MIKALDKASPTQKDELCTWLTQKEFDREEKISSVTKIFDKLKIKELTVKKIHDFYEEALASLDRLNRPSERKGELLNFASYLKTRNR